MFLKLGEFTYCVKHVKQPYVYYDIGTALCSLGTVAAQMWEKPSGIMALWSPRQCCWSCHAALVLLAFFSSNCLLGHFPITLFVCCKARDHPVLYPSPVRQVREGQAEEHWGYRIRHHNQASSSQWQLWHQKRDAASATFEKGLDMAS